MRDALFGLVVTCVLMVSLILCIELWTLGLKHACLYVPAGFNALFDVWAANWIYEG